ncbi:cytochrome p450 [Fusarium sporotrichioides]|uniref:Cytochrome p450 n=1 Tax=Fusarium sporotrichioides TaxID=5514 RepID=A0A395RT16_FUSSP|nr:cytochrome p450 [Fusarium sporotrichioides]
MPDVMNNAYQNYCKNGAICAVALPFSRPEILLPQHLIHWMTTQSDKVLSPTPVQHEIVAAEYAFLNSSVKKESAVYDVLRVQMNRHVSTLIPKLGEELTSAIDQTFGYDTEWKEVQMFLIVRGVIAKVIAWLVVGDVLCRDQQLVDNLAKFSSTVIPSAIAISLFPPFLQPISSRFTSFFNRVYMNRSLKVLGPYIEQRIAEVENGTCKTLSHEDVLTWHIEEAIRKKEPRDTMPDMIACRLFATILAALESTTLTMTHALFNISASERSTEIWDVLRNESEEASSAKMGQESVNKLHLADSAIKETLRLHTALKALSVQVMQPAGITLKDYGVHLPLGSRVSISAWGVHHDEDIYPNAYTYDAFRFAQLPQDGDDHSSNSHRMVSTSEKYLSFGYGKHACPGRHFASALTKMFLSHVAANYDLEQVDTKPGLFNLGHLPTPPMKAKLRMKRKSGFTVFHL